MTATDGLNPFLNLPFEVHYECIPIREFTLYSHVEIPNKLSDFTHLREHFGYSYKEAFKCQNKTGSELIFCLLEQHDEALPKWLEQLPHFGDEKWTGSQLFTLNTRGKKAVLTQIDNTSITDSSQEYYAVGDLIIYENSDHPDHQPTFILDSLGSRIQIDSFGWPISSNKKNSADQLFDPISLWDIDTGEECTTSDIHDSKLEFLNLILKSNLPNWTGGILELREN